MKSRERDLFLCSIGNTGTWTLVWNISRHPEIGGVKIVEYYKTPHQRPDFETEGDNKIHRLGVKGKEVTEGYSDDGRMLLFRHYHPSPNTTYDSLDSVSPPDTHNEAMMRMCYGVAPLRDPVESILTITHRPQSEPHQQTMDSRAEYWVEFVKFWKRELFHCIPLDTPMADEAWRAYQKWAQLDQIVEGDWGALNSSGRNEAHTAYSDGDIEAMLYYEPRMVRPVEILQANLATLRPFLEQHGYEDLPWWK